MSDAWVKQGNYAASHFTAMQGRVLFHMERLFRSTGGGIKAHAQFIRLCHSHGLPRTVTDFSGGECLTALMLIEQACRDTGLHHFRQIDTGWEQAYQQYRQLKLAA